MPVEGQRTDDGIFTVRVSGKLSAEDYGLFVPQVEQAIAELGKIRMLLIMQDFHGWEAAALWEDLKFDLKHFSDIEKLAMVGDRKWEHGMAVFCKPFTTAKIRYFDAAHQQEASDWLKE
jgi:hypothetical protein